MPRRRSGSASVTGRVVRSCGHSNDSSSSTLRVATRTRPWSRCDATFHRSTAATCDVSQSTSKRCTPSGPRRSSTKARSYPRDAAPAGLHWRSWNRATTPTRSSTICSPQAFIPRSATTRRAGRTRDTSRPHARPGCSRPATREAPARPGHPLGPAGPAHPVSSLNSRREPGPLRLGSGALQRVVVGTDLSATAERAVNWAATLADRYDAELVLVQVITDRRELGEGLEYAETELSRAAVEVAGPKARARVVVDADPAAAIVRIAVDEDADVIVVGNAGMSGRKQFLLANVPNRISHMATCTVIIVNSAVAVEADVRRTSSAFDTDAESHVEMVLTGRAADIARVMVKHGFAELNALRDGGDDRTEERARRLRLAFEELGPTFCKLGQILSTRPDLLPGPFIEELATLRDRVPPLTEAEIVQAMEQELRVPWEDVFDSIESEPLAAGTIAQVHRATLASGERVVV
ncbi:MAG: hypothetical protein E6G60_20565, partial [Actinobacteria bacterium]